MAPAHGVGVGAAAVETLLRQALQPETRRQPRASVVVPEREFSATLLQTPLATRLGLNGRVLVRLGSNAVTLTQFETNADCGRWLLSDIRRFGKDKGVFSLQLETLNPREARGVLFFRSKHAEDMYSHLAIATGAAV